VELRGEKGQEAISASQVEAPGIAVEFVTEVALEVLPVVADADSRVEGGAVENGCLVEQPAGAPLDVTALIGRCNDCSRFGPSLLGRIG
jgi:hypothetical protein